MCRENFKDIICYHNENLIIRMIYQMKVYLDSFISKLQLLLESVILLYLSFHLVRNLRNMFIYI